MTPHHGMLRDTGTPVTLLGDRHTAERASAVADGERRRCTDYDGLPYDQVAALLVRRAHVVAARTGLEPVEAAKTSECHELLAALVRSC